MTAEIIYGTDFQRAKGNGHTSICATSNGPALPVGECDCGGIDIPAMAQEIMDQVMPDTAPSEYSGHLKDPA